MLIRKGYRIRCFLRIEEGFKEGRRVSGYGEKFY